MPIPPPRRDRGGDGRARPGDAGGEPARRPARGADDAGGEARCRPCRTPGDCAAPGGRARVRRPSAHGRCGREKPGYFGQGSRGGKMLHRTGQRSPGRPVRSPTAIPADAAMAWAVEHLSEREAVFAKTDLLAAALAWKPGSVTIGEAEAAVARLEKAGTLHPCACRNGENPSPPTRPSPTRRRPSR